MRTYIVGLVRRLLDHTSGFLAVGLVGVSVAFGLLVGGSAAGQSAAAPAGEPVVGSTPPKAIEPGRELVELRSRRSRTYEGSGGVRVARVSAGSLNFERPDGGWEPIDSRLVRRGGALHNAANSFDLQVPETLEAGPVKVVDGDDWVALKLRDGQGRAVVWSSPALVDT